VAAIDAPPPAPMVEPVNYKLEVPIILGEAVLARFLSVALHESMHALTTKATGVELLQFSPVPGRCLGEFRPGCVVISGDGLTSGKHFAISSSGVLATRLTSEGFNFFADRDFTNRRVDQALAVSYFVFRWDMAYYVLNNAIYNWAGHPKNGGDDIQSVVNLMTDDREKQAWIFVGLTTAIVLDLIFDWDEIKTNWDRLWLK
jgi:hypothetical protein